MRLYYPPGTLQVTLTAGDWIHFSPTPVCNPFWENSVLPQTTPGDVAALNGFAGDRYLITNLYMRVYRDTIATVPGPVQVALWAHFGGANTQVLFQEAFSVDAVGAERVINLPMSLLLDENTGIHKVFFDSAADGLVLYQLGLSIDIIRL